MRPVSEQAKVFPTRSAASQHPMLYEINTRCWLRDLSTQLGRPINLGIVPETEFTRWRELGFTHIWLMGVWTSGPHSRQQALDDVEMVREYREVFGGEDTSGLAGSPYAIAEYSVPPALGGDSGLRKLRQKLHAHGLKLVLDFAPNHVGLDHPWLTERPELFVHRDNEFAEAFAMRTRHGTVWMAHGKDPHFFSWIDPAQLDYRVPETREAMFGVLASVAERCDGVRCDMAMLVLNEVFAKNWAKIPTPNNPPEREVWADAITEVRLAHPGFLFLGEVYWGLEEKLLELGFDYTYDKHLYDLVIHRKHLDVQAHLLQKGPEFIRRTAHFLENHDESRVASLLSLAEHRAAALVMFGLPGLRMLHEGQLTGARIKVPVQFGRRPVEPSQPEIERLYEYLLAALSISAVGKGEFQLLVPAPAWADNTTSVNIVIVQWKAALEEFDLVAVNLAPHASQCHIHPTIGHLADRDWEMKDLLGEEHYIRRGDDLATRGLYLDLKPHAAQLFHFRPVGYSAAYLEAHAAKF